MVGVFTHDDENGESLVQTMTCPTMIGGFTLNSIVFSFYLPGMAAMVTRSVWVLGLIPLFLLLSYFVCLERCVPV